MDEVFQFIGYIDLVNNECAYIDKAYSNDDENAIIESYSNFLARTADMIIDERQKSDYLQHFNRNNLLDKFYNNQKMPPIKYKTVLDNGDTCWIETRVILISNDNNEYVAAILSKNINAEMSQLEHMERLMKKESIYKTAINADASGYFEVNLTQNIIISKIYDYHKSKMNPEIEETPNNIRTNIEQLISILQPNTLERGIELNINIKNVVDEEIYVDTLRLDRIIMNILSNSLKYTKPGGSIDVIVEQLPSDREGYGKYDFVFSDTGIGMSKEFLETIFDSFTREKTSTVSGIQGTGLGMAITKNFVELMGDTIEIDSALGLGTTVTCHMYFRIQVHEIPQDISDDTCDNIDFSKIRILLVEDNELNCEIAKDILEEIGVNVEEASDGSVAVDMVTLKPPGYYDIIFMDIQMPYMDGYKATQTIRNMERDDIASLPIIAMTANAFEEDKKKAFAVGMNGHFAKPLNVREIIKTICKYGCKYAIENN